MKELPQQPQHIPVLRDAVVRFLEPGKNESYLDLTAGYGGHSEAILNLTGSEKTATLVDRDINAINVVTEKFPQAEIIQSDFLAASKKLLGEKRSFDMILIDLGVSSPQLDNAERGFSFSKPAPLDMRMDQESGITAAEFIASTSSKDLAKIIHEYGGEGLKLAESIAKNLKKYKPTTTTAAAEVIAQVYPHGYHKINPATRTFQALRIAVNDELGQIKELLPLLPELLNDGGRVAIISFHSLEDRLVKRYFHEQSRAGYESELTELTKKPILGETEDVNNRRARSAKLRVACKK
jgi:16S rRNA (cytosine1402-N4)-methyltransferase